MKPSTPGVAPRRFEPQTHAFEPEESVNITSSPFHFPDQDICRWCGKLLAAHILSEGDAP